MSGAVPVPGDYADKAFIEQFVKAMMTDERVKARTSPAGFALIAGRGQWKLAKHLVYLNQKLMDVASGRCKRLIIEMPPRHGKSDFVTQKFVAWYLGTFPDKRVIVTGYSDDFAADFGFASRTLLEEFGQQFWGVSVSRKSAAKDNWSIEGHTGKLKTAGARGSLTGRGGDLIVIDDPVKTAEEANSKTIQEKTWEWYRGTLRTRLQKGGAIIVIMTRWSENDLVGKLLREAEVNKENGADQWDVVCLPAIAEDNDPLGRKTGEALWPENYDEVALGKLKLDVGAYWWNALYQQRPAPLEGGMFKRVDFRYFTTKTGRLDDSPNSKEMEYYELDTQEAGKPIKRIPKDKIKLFGTMDTAGKTGERNDYTVIAIWGVTPDHDMLLFDVFRDRIDTTQHIPAVRNMWQRWKPRYIGVEDKMYGTNLIQAMKVDLEVLIKPLKEKADVDKQTRATPLSIRMENHQVYFRKGIGKLAEVEDELASFPNGEHDDVVDACAYAAIEIMQKRQINVAVF